MKHLLSLIILGVCVVVAACSPEPEARRTESSPVPKTSQASQTPSETAAPGLNTDKSALSIEEYVNAAASRSVDELRQAAKHVAVDSPAAVYLQHQANVNEAGLDGGASFPEGVVKKAAKGAFLLCGDDGKDCIEFDDFEQNAQGQLSAFTIEGNAIGDLVSQGDGKPVRAGGARFTFLTSYLSQQSNAVFIVAKVATGSQPIDLHIYSSTYRSPDGKQRTAGGGGGPTELAAKSNAYIYSAFEGVKPGGLMTLEGCVADCSETYELQIRTR